MKRRHFLKVAAATGVGVAAELAAPATSFAAPPVGSCAFSGSSSGRLCDTRNGVPQAGVVRIDSRTIRITVTGRFGVPADTAAVAVGIAAVGVPGAGFTVAYPGGSKRPTAANLNFTARGQTLQSMAVVRLGVEGTIDVYSSTPCNVTVDLLGVFRPVTANTAAGRYLPFSKPVRVRDTRSTGVLPAGGWTRVDLSALVPTHASAAVVHLTCAGSVGSGFFVCYQDGVARPKLSHLNCDGPWQIRASQAIVPLQPGTRSIRVYSSGGGHVVLDLVGYITGPNSGASATGLFVPAAAPQRRLDTRVVNGLGWMPEGWTVEASLPAGVSAAAAVWNLAVAQASVPGYLSMYPARTLRPKSAQICVQAIGQTSNSHSWSRVSSSGSAIYAASGGAVIADYAGYFVGTPAARTTSAVANRSPAIGPPYTLEIPRIGLSMPVDLGSSSIVDYGYGWIMPGSVNVGENGYVIVFAHRTTGAGPFRYLHYLDAGDEVTLVDGFGKRWVHRVNRTSITGSSNYSIINGVLASPTPGISLVACSKSNGTPTSLQYRIVVSAAREFIIVP